MFFRSDFRQQRKKMILEHFLSGPNETKFESRKISEIIVNSVKVAFYGYSKWQNSSVFQDST